MRGIGNLIKNGVEAKCNRRKLLRGRQMMMKMLISGANEQRRQSAKAATLPLHFLCTLLHNYKQPHICQFLYSHVLHFTPKASQRTATSGYSGILYICTAMSGVSDKYEVCALTVFVVSISYYYSTTAQHLQVICLISLFWFWLNSVLENIFSLIETETKDCAKCDSLFECSLQYLQLCLLCGKRNCNNMHPTSLIRVLARLAGEYAVIYYHHHCTTTIVIITIRALCIYDRAGLRAVFEFELLFRVNRFI